MKKLLLITFALTIAGLTVVAYEIMRVTEPYRIEPISVALASKDSVVGYTLDEKNETLSVVSYEEIVLVSEPSFLYDVIWLVPIKSGVPGKLTEYKYKLSKYARKEHINHMDVMIPEKILQIAARTSWN
jgi:hypothetical protein